MPRSPSHSSRTGNRPLYAIDFTAVACGKRIANTKRRVRWRFGFANPDALAAGETGTACRGEEHDVTLVWSVTSGKRLILADGQEVHYSNSRSAVIDFSWTMRGNHVLKVVAHATAPMSAEPVFRQYDFFVDGRSFFSFPKVYRLGLTGNRTVSPDAPRQSSSQTAESSSRRKMLPSGGGGSIAAIEAPHNPDEEEAYLREAIKASLESEAKRKEGGKGEENEKPKMSAAAADLLIDFFEDFDAQGNTLALEPSPAGGNEWALAPAPAQSNNQWAMAPAPPPAQPDNSWAMSAPAPVQQQPSYNQYGGGGVGYAAAPSNPFMPSSPALAPVQAGSFAAPPPAQMGSFSAPAPAQMGSFSALAPPAGDPFGASSFAQPPPPSAASFSQPPAVPAPVDPFSPQLTSAPSSSPTKQPPAPATNGSGAKLTMSSLTMDGLLAGGATQQEASVSLADKALQNLMGSIDSFGLSGAAAKPPSAKNPFDSNNILSNATLGEIKSSKVTEKKSIMNAPPPAAGAMVMAGSQAGNWGGYGAGGMGASMGGGMQQQAPMYSMSGGYPQQQQQQMGYGQQPMMGQQQPMMGQPMMGQQQPMMGQQQGYGAPQYGQQPPMQQNQWGGPSY